MVNYIPEAKIDEVRNRADIVEIISNVVRLKRTGRNFVGLCPFHAEKTPSFSVNPEMQIFKCFGCGEGGNVFHFLMKYDRLAFPEAVRQLATQYGIDLPSAQLSDQEQQRMRRKEQLYGVHEIAQKFYSKNLQSPAGRQAQKYLEDRGFSQETINTFGLGYAPDAWGELAQLFTKQNLLKTAEAAGLIQPQKNSSGYYDRFRDRVIFPISDSSGRVVGFGGRVMGDGMPKYLNSPESPIFSKRRLFYGLHLTRQHCRNDKLAYVVEGYSDLISLYQAGVRNVVATLGTALTKEHVTLLKGFPEKVILVFDGDTAGAKAALRSGPLFVNQGLEFKIFALPKGYDPDIYVNEVGGEVFKENAAWGVGLIEFALDCALREHGQSVSGKVKVVDDVGPLLAAVDDPVAKSLFIKMVAEKIGVDESAVSEHARQAVGSRSIGRSLAETQNPPPQERLLPANKLEVQLLTMMIQYAPSIPLVKKHDVVDFFTSSVIEQIARHVIEVYETEDFNIARLIETTDDAKEREIISSLAMKEERWNQEGCLRLIQQFDTGQTQKKDDIFDAIKAAEASGDQHEVARLLKQLGQEARRSHSIDDPNETIH